MTTTRRKYRFRTRGEAEDALRKEELKRSLVENMLHKQFKGIAPTVFMQLTRDHEWFEALVWGLEGMDGGKMLLKMFNSKNEFCAFQAWYVDEFLAEYRYRDSSVDLIQDLRQLAWQIYTKREALFTRKQEATP